MASPTRSLRRIAPLFLLLLAACGSAQNRPEVVGTYPGNLEILSGTLAAIRVDYNEPVTVLNPSAVIVVADGLQIPITSFQLAGEPNSVYVIPLPQTAFRPGALHNVRILEGLAINRDEHYSFDEATFAFVLGDSPPIATGAPQAVRIFDRNTFVLQDTIPTPNPGTDVVVGVQSTQSDAGRRYWVQRSDPGTGTDSFAYFDTGDATMTDVPLTKSGMASTLVSDASAIAIGRVGAFLYVAFREEPEQHVRLAKIDIAAGAEVDSLVLSPTVGVDTKPTGLTLSLNRDEIVVACQEGAAGRLVFVDTETFTEIDRDFVAAGTQGAPLPHPPGDVREFVDRYIVTAFDGSGMVSAQQVILPTYVTVETPSLTMGTGGASMATLDRALSVQSVTGYTGGEALVARSIFTSFSTAIPLIVSDDVGGMSTNTTTVIAAARFPTIDRFLLVHDGGILTRWLWNTIQLFQEDLDDMTDGIQAVDGGASWADIVTIGTDAGQFPP
ncbi:MAG: hypothetical protein QNJ98_01925 [Planctomycetota bacterium]|nr:hypothetical protein [Planctomycetota bacterium]